jgi:hypothetical protein
LTDSQTHLSATRKPEFTTICTGTSGLYTINATFFGVPVNQTIVKKGLAGGLMMNVIACGFAGVAFVCGLLGWALRKRSMIVVSPHHPPIWVLG